MMILVINGPNLNMLGIREPEIYGKKRYEDLEDMIYDHCAEIGVGVDVLQSNHEGEIVEMIQDAYDDEYDAIIINPAAYTHTSVAILDALKAVGVPAVEVHISDLSKRESFRQISYVSEYCEHRIIGHGFEGYIEAVDYLVNKYPHLLDNDDPDEDNERLPEKKEKKGLFRLW